MMRVALRAMLTRPVRSAVLSGGFGLSVAVMAGLLGVGEVILAQARAPELEGGGHVVVSGTAGRVPNAHHLVTGLLKAPRFKEHVAVAAPFARQRLYLVRKDGSAVSVRATAGIPGPERALRDPETSEQPRWTDTLEDAAWVDPPPADVLRRIDRFHAIPDVPRYADSWMEWLYFNGSAGEARFHLTLLAGPRDAQGRQVVGVRLQLRHGGRERNWWDTARIGSDELLASAPDLDVGGCRVRLVGSEYRVHLEFDGRRSDAPERNKRLSGELILQADPGRSMAPVVLRGAGGWLSGYVVPVFRGALRGELRFAGQTLSFEGGGGYHDHNWGFWEGVSWRWGQVARDGLSFVYGRVLPPPEAADPERVPAFLGVVGAEGPLAFSRDVNIVESGAGPEGGPQKIKVHGRGPDMDLTLSLRVAGAARTPWGPRRDRPADLELLQMHGDWRVSGTLEGRAVDFATQGSAETFRPLARARSPATGAGRRGLREQVTLIEQRR